VKPESPAAHTEENTMIGTIALGTLIVVLWIANETIKERVNETPFQKGVRSYYDDLAKAKR
jgi:hypothetical protein